MIRIQTAIAITVLASFNQIHNASAFSLFSHGRNADNYAEMDLTTFFKNFIAQPRFNLYTDLDSTVSIRVNTTKPSGIIYEPAVNKKFTDWCSSHNGVATNNVPYGQLPSGSAGAQFLDTINRIESVSALPHEYRTGMVCYKTGDKDSLLGAIIFSSEFRAESDGKIHFQVGVYEPAAITEFLADYGLKAKAQLQAQDDAFKKKWEERKEKTRHLRENPKVGDETLMGIIVAVRKPLVQIQYNYNAQHTFGKPQLEWVKISTIQAPYTH